MYRNFSLGRYSSLGAIPSTAGKYLIQGVTPAEGEPNPKFVSLADAIDAYNASAPSSIIPQMSSETGVIDMRFHSAPYMQTIGRRGNNGMPDQMSVSDWPANGDAYIYSIAIGEGAAVPDSIFGVFGTPDNFGVQSVINPPIVPTIPVVQTPVYVPPPPIAGPQNPNLIASPAPPVYVPPPPIAGPQNPNLIASPAPPAASSIKYYSASGAAYNGEAQSFWQTQTGQWQMGDKAGNVTDIPYPPWESGSSSLGTIALIVGVILLGKGLFK